MAVDLANPLRVNSQQGESPSGASSHDVGNAFSAAQADRLSGRSSGRSSARSSRSSSLSARSALSLSTSKAASNYSSRVSLDEHFRIGDLPSDAPAVENASPMLRELQKAQRHFDAAMSGTDAEGGQRKLDPANGDDVAAFLARQPGGLVDSHQAMATYRTHQENHFALMQEKGLDPESAEDISRYMDTLESVPAAAQEKAPELVVKQAETATPQAAEPEDASVSTEAKPAPEEASVSAMARDAKALVEAFIAAEKRDDAPTANALVPQIQTAVDKMGGQPAELLKACFSAQTRAQLQASSRKLNDTLKLLSEIDEAGEETMQPPPADDHNLRQVAVSA